MSEEDKNLQAAHELGKIYFSILDKKLLCDFFIDNVLALVSASSGFLFMAGNKGQLWLESTNEAAKEVPDGLRAQGRSVFEKGKPVQEERALWIPLVVRNSSIGLACFLRKSEEAPFAQKDFTLATDLTYQLAGALKNLTLFEENLKMERLAAIGQTVGVVLHEVKNIIQLAVFSKEHLRIGIEKKKEEFLKRGFEGIQRSLREMDGFIYEMLSLTKDYKITPEKFRWQSLLNELETDLAEKAVQYQVRLESHMDEAFPEVEGEPRSLYRALLNLVKNALEACDKEDSFIRVTVQTKDKDWYEVKVEDNGKGMDEEVKARIFQAFFTTKGEKGTGLGLMIIERTIKAHQGRLQVDSKVGQGTTFTITLPKKLSP